LTAIPNILFV